MRIDCHGHGLHAEKDPNGNLVPPVMVGWKDGPQTPAQYVQTCRKAGVDRVVLLDPAHVAFGLRDIFGDFAIPVPMVDADAIRPEEIDALLARGAAGIKFICPMHSYGDNRYFPLYEAILGRNALAVFHTGYLSDKLHRPGGLLGAHDYVDITHMRPAAIDRIARAFPRLKILMAHFGNPWYEEAWSVIHSFKNVYADISGGTSHKRSMRMWEQIFTHDGRADMASISKLCFGSDSSFCFQNVFQFDGHIAFYERFFETMGVPAEVREQVNRGNMERLIGQGG